MSKPIRVTEEMLVEIQKEFLEEGKKLKMFDGDIEYKKSFTWETDGPDTATVVFTPTAFAKMTMLVQRFSSEVAWHGVAKRDEEQENLFHITDILVYPQIVTGSNVDTDQIKYQTWLYDLGDEEFDNLRMQGHSHVDFATSPSAVDKAHQEEILAQLEDDMFYIFMIWNKRFERTLKIFDLANNTLYDNEDITVLIGEENLDEFIKEAEELVVRKPTYQAGVTTNYAGSGKPYGGNPAPGKSYSGKTDNTAKGSGLGGSARFGGWRESYYSMGNDYD